MTSTQPPAEHSDDTRLAQLQSHAAQTARDHLRAVAVDADRYPLILGSIEARKARTFDWLLLRLQQTATRPDTEAAAVLRGLLEGLADR